jgi:HlyD family secretion protein
MIANTTGQDEIITKQRPKVSWRIVVILLGVITVSIMTWPMFKQWFGGVPTIARDTLLLAQVIKGDLIRDIAVSGKLVAANAPQLYSSESGVVDLLVKPGDSVEQGQVVAQIASPELAAEIRQQQAKLVNLQVDAQRGELADKEAQLELEGQLDSNLVSFNAAKREKQRADISYEKQVVSELQWAAAQDTLQEAELLYKHAQKKVSLAKERLHFEQQNRQNTIAGQQLVLDELLRRQQALDVRAPVSGVVGNWLIAQKDKVANSVPLMTVVDLTRYEAELNVPEFYADELGLGLSVSIQLAGQQLVGTIMSISPEINNNQVQVRASIKDIESLKPRQNQRLNARIEFENKNNVLMVKRGAFLQTNDGQTAYLTDEHGFATAVPIQTGASSVDYVEIVSGLKANDTIIISAYDDFTSHSRIKLSH